MAVTKLEDALYAHLTSSTGLSAKVGGRVYPVKLPQGVTLPAVTYRRISTTRVSAFSQDTEDARARVQLSCWDTSFDEARDTKEEVRAAIQRFGGTASGVTIDQIFLVNERHLFEDDTEIHQLILDAMVHYQESTT